MKAEWGHKDGAWSNKISILLKGHQETPPCFLAPREDTVRRLPSANHQESPPQKPALPKLDLNFQSSEGTQSRLRQADSKEEEPLFPEGSSRCLTSGTHTGGKSSWRLLCTEWWGPSCTGLWRWVRGGGSKQQHRHTLLWGNLCHAWGLADHTGLPWWLT